MKLLKYAGLALVDQRRGLPFSTNGRWGSRWGGIFGNNSRLDWARLAGGVYDNSVVLPAISWKWRAASATDLIIEQETPDGWRRVSDTRATAMLQVFRKPNEYYDWRAILFGLQLSWDTRGNAYLFKIRSATDKVVGFYWLPPDRVEVYSDWDNADGTKLITHYVYKPYGGHDVKILPRDMVHFRHGIDPKDERLGLSPVYSSLRDVVTENEAATWMANVITNMGMPSAIVMPKTMGDDEPDAGQLQLFADKMQEFTVDMRGKLLPFPIPVEFVSPSWKPSDLELVKQRADITGRICAALGVDAMVLGLPSENKTYSNLAEATDAAGKQTILPQLDAWAETLTNSVLHEDVRNRGFRLRFSTERVFWLADETDAIHTRNREDFKAGAIDLYRVKELNGEKPEPRDKGVTYFDLQARAREIALKPVQGKISHDARRMVWDNEDRKTACGCGAEQKDEGNRTEKVNPYQGRHDREIRKYHRNLLDLAREYGEGKVQELQFRDKYSAEIEKLHTRLFEIGQMATKGEIDKDAALRHGQIMRDLEQPFIQGLAKRITDGVYNDEDGEFDPTSGLLDAHTKLYASKGSSSATAAFVDNSGDEEEFTWRLGVGEEHCDDCPYVADGSPYTKSTLYLSPRDGSTQCLSNCKCYLVRSSDGLVGFKPTF